MAHDGGMVFVRITNQRYPIFIKIHKVNIVKINLIFILFRIFNYIYFGKMKAQSKKIFKSDKVKEYCII